MTFEAWKPIAVCLAVAVAGPAFAQSAERVAAHTDWSVFVAANPKECYIVSPPENWVARRDGKTVEVNRGDIRLYVSFRPERGVANEVSFNSGYPLKPGNPVKLEIGSNSFNLSPGEGAGAEWAWTDDARAVTAMRAGAEAKITGVSARGTTTVDTFSLSGFTAAITDAEARCK